MTILDAETGGNAGWAYATISRDAEGSESLSTVLEAFAADDHDGASGCSSWDALPGGGWRGMVAS